MAKIKKRADGRYTVTATVNGKRKYFYGCTRVEAQDKCDKFMKKSENLANFDGDITIAEWSDEWLRIKEPTVTTGTLASYRDIIRHYIIPDIGAVKLADLTAPTVRRFLDLKLETLSSRTVRYIHTVLSAMLKQAVQDEIIGTNVAAKVRKPKLQKTREMITLTPDEVKKFLAEISDPEQHMIFKMAFASGCRRSELLGLPWANVDFKKKTITITQIVIKINNVAVISETTKNTSSRRSITLDNETIAELKTHEKRVKKRRFSTPNWIHNDLVFPGKDGSPIFPDSVSLLCKKYAAKIGKPAFSMHGTRHTHATLLIEAGVNFKVIQARLGHASFTETMNTYSHLTPTMEYDAVEKIEQILS
nr:MAG TPA: Integrase [Caudoviricetes sp.]